MNVIAGIVGCVCGIVCFLVLSIIRNKLGNRGRGGHCENLECSPLQPDMADRRQPEKEYEPSETIDLMFNTLRALGCQPTKNANGSLSVSYQGENFVVDFGGRIAWIWDPEWAQMKADDPNLPKLREAINVTNFCYGPTVVMTSPNDEGLVGLHSQRNVMLHPACPDNVEYVQATLDSFFRIKEELRNRYQQIKAQQTETNHPSRPVGFNPEMN